MDYDYWKDKLFHVFANNNFAPTYLSDTQNRVGLSGYNTGAATDFNIGFT